MATVSKKVIPNAWGNTCHVALFRDRKADWQAFGDVDQPGYRRAQHRYIGPGASGKADPHAIPSGNFTLSIMYMPPGQGSPLHTHEVEEAFFVLQGHIQVFWDDAQGQRHEARLGPWDCILCAPNVMRGFHNDGLEPCYMQVMLGKAAPDLPSYADASLQLQRDAHLRG